MYCLYDLIDNRTRFFRRDHVGNIGILYKHIEFLDLTHKFRALQLVLIKTLCNPSCALGLENE